MDLAEAPDLFRGPALAPVAAAEEARVSEPLALATADLRREHQLIRRGLRLLEHAGRRLAAGRSVDDPATKVLVGLLRRLADQCHHGKEEGCLYPSMRAKGLPTDGQLRVLLAAHSEGRDYLGTLAGLPSPAERAAAALLTSR